MTDYPKPAWAKALDIQAQSALDAVAKPTLDAEYLAVTVQKYGNLTWDSPELSSIANSLKFQSWLEEHEKRKAYDATPEGKAKLEAARLAGIKEAKRLAKVQKRWQWLHDKLAAKGCECNHEWCGDY